VSSRSLEFLAGLGYLGKVAWLMGGTYLVFTVCYVLGDMFLEKIFTVQFNKRERILIKIALGITLISFLLMLLGFFSLLSLPVIGILFLIILGLGWKSGLFFLKTTLINPIPIGKHLKWWGFGSFFLILLFISFNTLTNVRPVPFGFDALSVYLNLPNLIAFNKGLVEGYSPYYWSLFVSIGNILFDQIEMVIALSVSGGILSLFVVYEISKKWLDSNYALIVTLMLCATPLINYQSFRDIKTDLGLMFILLILVLVLIKWLSMEDEKSFLPVPEYVEKNKMKGKAKKINRKKSLKSKERPQKVIPVEKNEGVLGKYLSQSTQLIIILGILSGMSLGIKLTGLIAILGVLSVFSYMKGGTAGFLANFFLTFFIVLIAGLDTSLRPYHFGADYLKWISLVLGLLALAVIAYKSIEKFKSLVKIGIIYISFLTLLYIPWPLKNYQETQALSFKTITEGKVIGVPSKVKK